MKLRLVSDEQLESKESESKLAMQVQRFYEEVLTQTRQRIDEKVLLEVIVALLVPANLANSLMLKRWIFLGSWIACKATLRS